MDAVKALDKTNIRMKASTNWKTVIGIALMLCWPTLVIWEGFQAYLAPRWYYSTAIIERRSATLEEMNKAFQEVAPDSPEGTFKTAENTDTAVTIGVRDLKAQPASDKANSIAAAIVAKLQKRGPEPPSIVFPAHPELHPTTFPIGPNLLFGAVIGLIPALGGLILILLGRRARAAAPINA